MARVITKDYHWHGCISQKEDCESGGRGAQTGEFFWPQGIKKEGDYLEEGVCRMFGNWIYNVKGRTSLTWFLGFCKNSFMLAPVGQMVDEKFVVCHLEVLMLARGLEYIAE